MEDINKEQIEQELLPFLSPDARTDLRCIAMMNFLGLTGTDKGKAFLTDTDKYLIAIAKLTMDTEPEITKDAYFALINLSTDEGVSLRLLRLENIDLVSTCLEYILNKTSAYADIACSLLANLTRFEKGAKMVADVIMAKQDIVGIDKLVNAMCMKDYNPKNKFHYIGVVLANLTQSTNTRQFILDRERCVIQRLLTFTEYYDSEVRRHGVVATLKNCCFDTSHHEWLLSEQVDALPRLLLPLAGPEELDDDDNETLPPDLQYLEPSKQREPTPEIRKMLVEAILQLCATKAGRLYIKDKNAYVILRELHKWEKDKACLFAIENLVDILIKDEPQEGMENLKDVDVPPHLTETFNKEDEVLLKDDETDTSVNK